MSLFDDILPQYKSNPPAGGNPPTQNDPLAPNPQITITESVAMNITPPMTEIVPTETIPDTPAPVAQIPVDSSGILIIDGMDATPVVPFTPPPEVQVSPVSEVLNVSGIPPTSSDLPAPAHSGLFSLVSDTPISPVSEVSSISNVSDLSSATVNLQATPPVFQTTEDLIAHEISDLDEFILSLDGVDRAKREQEAEYKSQKEHFAELEIQAESEHQKVLTERSHAEKMKAYLEAEMQ
jgi:hypothetical protein